jgi:hypothetical protein
MRSVSIMGGDCGSDSNSSSSSRSSSANQHETAALADDNNARLSRAVFTVRGAFYTTSDHPCTARYRAGGDGMHAGRPLTGERLDGLRITVIVPLPVAVWPVVQLVRRNIGRSMLSPKPVAWKSNPATMTAAAAHMSSTGR